MVVSQRVTEKGEMALYHLWLKPQEELKVCVFSHKKGSFGLFFVVHIFALNVILFFFKLH